MTTVARTGFIIAIVGASTLGSESCAATFASGMDGTSTAAQHAAIGDDICAGVPAKEREMGLLAFRDGIVSVAPLREESFVGKSKISHTEGAIIGLRAAPGISVPWLERVNSCHVALVESGRLVGYGAALDPFVIPGTTVGAVAVYAGYALYVRGNNYDMAREIIQRSNALLPAPSRLTSTSPNSP
jgi:hypothetical protein